MVTLDRREAVLGTFFLGVSGQATAAAPRANGANNGMVNKYKITANGPVVRDLDLRLPGAVRNTLLSPNGTPQPDPGTTGQGLILAGCDVGVWLMSNEIGKESTLQLDFQSSISRKQYTVSHVTAKKDFRQGVETGITPPVKVSYVKDLQEVISFGGRAVRRLGGRLFYLTTFGMFFADSTLGDLKWISCASDAIKPLAANNPLAYQPNFVAAPLGCSDISFIGSFVGSDCYLVAADDGIYIFALKAGSANHTKYWTKLPVLNSGPCLRILRSKTKAETVRADASNSSITRTIHSYSSLCLVSNRLHALEIAFADDGKVETVSTQKAVFTENRPHGPVDILEEIKDIYGAFDHGSEGFSLASEIGVSNFTVSPSAGDSDEVVSRRKVISMKSLSPNMRTLAASYFMFGDQVSLGKDGQVVIANIDSVIVASDSGLFEVGLPFGKGTDLEDQFITSVNAGWGGTITAGTSAGNVFTFPLSPANGTLSRNNIYSRRVPEYLEDFLLVGIPIRCPHGEYTLDNAPDCGSDYEEQQKQLFKEAFTGVIAILATGGAAGPSTILSLMTHAFIAQWATESPVGAQIASTLFGYRGKSVCMIIPSNPCLSSETVKMIIPRIVEGQLEDAMTSQYGVVDLGPGPYTNTTTYKDTPVGWSALRFSGEERIKVANVDAKVEYIHFKNWSHDRGRTVRVDLIVNRPARLGRLTHVVP